MSIRIIIVVQVLSLKKSYIPIVFVIPLDQKLSDNRGCSSRLYDFIGYKAMVRTGRLDSSLTCLTACLSGSLSALQQLTIFPKISTTVAGQFLVGVRDMR